MPVPSWRQPKHTEPQMIYPGGGARFVAPAEPAPEPIDNISYAPYLDDGITTRLRSGITLTHAQGCTVYRMGSLDDWRTVCDCFVSRAKITAFEDGTLTAVPYEFVHSLYAQIVSGHKTVRDAKSLWQNQLAENERLRVRAALAIGLGALGWAYGIARGLGWF